ncbi:DUF3352 domain-containing protein, partial [bacterium]|nr:DUF3352 domain-containing protein [bacterium]
MKKLVTLFLTISALFALSARAQQIPYQDWYPAETLLLVSHDAEQSLGRDFPHFKKGISQFCDSLNDIMEYRLFSEFLTSSIEEYGVQKDFSAIVGQRATFGIFALDPFAAKLPIALYISEVPNKEKADAVLQSFFAAAKKGLPSLAIETDEYHGHVLKTLHGPGMIPGIGLSYTFQNSQLILSNNKPALVRMLDEHEYQENRLASNPIYQSVLKKLPQPRYLTFYINFNAITKTVTHVLDFFKSMEDNKKKKNGNSENIIHTWESTQS